MKLKRLLFSVLMITGLYSFAQIPTGYYDGTAGLTGVALRQN